MVRAMQCLLDVVNVWNPFTIEYEKLPSVSIIGKPDCVKCGFCYHCNTDDFKVVSLACDDDKFWFQVHLYTRGRSNS